MKDYIIPEGLYYTREHLWVKVEGKNATVGITDFGQSQLGDVVFVELPKINISVESGDKVATVESIKAAIDVFSPLTGKIVNVNTDLNDDPQLINTDPYTDGWIYELEMADISEIEDLMTAEDYKAYIEEEGETEEEEEE